MKGKPNTIERVWKVGYLQVSKEIPEKVTVALWGKGTPEFFFSLFPLQILFYTLLPFFW